MGNLKNALADFEVFSGKAVFATFSNECVN